MLSSRIFLLLSTVLLVGVTTVSTLAATDKQQKNKKSLLSLFSQLGLGGRQANRCNPACQDAESCVKTGAKQWICVDQNTFQLMVANGTVKQRGGMKALSKLMGQQKNQNGMQSAGGRGKLLAGLGFGRGNNNGTGMGFGFGSWTKLQKECNPACQTGEFCVPAGSGQWSCKDQNGMMAMMSSGSCPFAGLLGDKKGKKGTCPFAKLLGKKKGNKKNQCNPACQGNQQCMQADGQWSCQDAGAPPAESKPAV